MIVYFDLETGGLEEHHPDIQIAAAAVNADGEVVRHFQRKIQFEASRADQKALDLNHYDPEVWKAEAVPEAQVVSEFSQFLGNFKSLSMMSKRTGRPYGVARLGGYNAATFDGPRIKMMFARHNAFLPAHPQVLCVMQRVMWWSEENRIQLENLKLGTVCKFLGVELEDAHDALGDVVATAAVARRLRDPWPRTC